MRCACGYQAKVAAAACPRCGRKARPAEKKPLAGPAKARRKRLILVVASAGGGLALLVIILAVVLGGGSGKPKAPDKAPPAAVKQAEAKPAAPAPVVVVDPALSEREMFAKGEIARALRSLERRLSGEWVNPELREQLTKARADLVQAADERYVKVLEEAHKAAGAGGIAEARTMLEEAAAWGITAVKQRAERDIEELGEVVRAARAARAEASRKEREDQKRSAEVAFETVVGALANVRADAPPEGADETTGAIREAGDVLWKRVATARLYAELLLFSEALHFEDGLYLDALLARYGGDGDEWKRWSERNTKDLRTAVADAIGNTAAVVDDYNGRVKPPVDLDAFLGALDRLSGKDDALGLAQVRFLMASWRLEIGRGRTEMTEYVLARLGLGRSKLFTDVTEEVRPSKPPPPPPPPEPPGPGRRTVQLGAYVPELKELVLWRSKDLAETLRHEAFHQFVDVYVRDCPPWFNEGYATFAEVSRRGMPADHPRRERELLEGLGRVLPMRRLMALSLEQWQASSDVSLHYAQAWSFINFLMRTGRRARLDRYFDELMLGASHAAALRTAFDDLDALEREWRGTLRR